jgi:hypothetical protein
MAARLGQARVDGKDGVAGVPGGTQRIDEARAGREIERYQLRHAR